MTYHDKALGLAGAVILSVFATGASATPINLTYQGPSANDPMGVTIRNSPVSSAFNPVGAFGFKMAATDPDTSDPLGRFLAWCLDIGTALGTNSAFGYKITNTPFGNSFGLDGSERDRVQAVFDANYRTLDATNGKEAAGFQVALWDALYDNDGDATTGTFSVAPGLGIRNQANVYLTNAGNYTGNKAFNLTFYESTADPQRQNLVAATPVPLPAAGLLLLGGLGGLAAMRRRKRAA